MAHHLNSIRQSVFWNYLVAAFIVLLLVAAPARSETREIRLGVLSDLSGKMAYWGHQTSLGASLAEEDLKAADIPVRIIIEDTVLDTTKTTSATQKLLSADHVEGVFGEFTPITSAASPILKNAKTIFLYSSGTVTSLKDNPYALKTFIDFPEGCRLLAEHWKKSGLKKIALLKIALEPGELCLAGLQKIFPDVQVSSYNPGESVSSQLFGLKQKGAEAIANVGYEPDLLNTMKAVQEYGYAGQIGSNEGAVTSQVSQKYASLMSKVTVFGLPAVNEEFINRILKKDPANTKASIDAAALSYLHLTQLARAISACPAQDVECQMAKVSESKSESLLEFKGWKDRVAQFAFPLRTWKNNALVVVDSPAGTGAAGSRAAESR